MCVGGVSDRVSLREMVQDLIMFNVMENNFENSMLPSCGSEVPFILAGLIAIRHNDLTSKTR